MLGSGVLADSDTNKTRTIEQRGTEFIFIRMVRCLLNLKKIFFFVVVSSMKNSKVGMR